MQNLLSDNQQYYIYSFDIIILGYSRVYYFLIPLMKALIATLKEKLVSNFWFLPLVLIISSLVLSQIMLYIDESIRLWEKLGLNGNIEWYRAILSSISSSMMTIAWLVFSITLVALTLAAGQFWSRVLKNFMKDRLNQIILWIYLATFTYALLILRVIQEDSVYNYSPHISIHFAIFLAVVNIILLVFFIHHISRWIQADNLIEDIYKDLLKQIKELKILEEIPVSQESQKHKVQKLLKKHPIHTNIFFEKDGYIEYIDTKTLSCIAKELWCIVYFQYWHWDYVMKRITVVKTYSSHKLGEDEIQKLKKCIHIWNQRLQENDIRFAFWQIVQIAVRALSPWINDPFTAITALNKLWSAISELSFRELPKRYISQDTIVRVILSEVSYSDIVTLAFSQIRYYSAWNPHVMQVLLQVYQNLLSLPLDEEKKEVIEKKKDILMQYTKENIDSKADLKYAQSVEKYSKML